MISFTESQDPRKTRAGGSNKKRMWIPNLDNGGTKFIVRRQQASSTASSAWDWQRVNKFGMTRIWVMIRKEPVIWVLTVALRTTFHSFEATTSCSKHRGETNIKTWHQHFPISTVLPWEFRLLRLVDHYGDIWTVPSHYLSSFNLAFKSIQIC